MIIADVKAIYQTPPLTPIITNLSTYRGGKNGPVTVIISGSGLNPHANVFLSRKGFENIAALSVIGDSIKKDLSATFDLSKSETGIWNFEVTNPNGQNVNLLNSFTIEEGGEYILSIDIIGREVVRVGRTSPNIINITNNGNIDAQKIELLILAWSDVFKKNLYSLTPDGDNNQNEFLDNPFTSNVVPIPIILPGQTIEIPFPIIYPSINCGFIGVIANPELQLPEKGDDDVCKEAREYLEKLKKELEETKKAINDVHKEINAIEMKLKQKLPDDERKRLLARLWDLRSELRRLYMRKAELELKIKKVEEWIEENCQDPKKTISFNNQINNDDTTYFSSLLEPPLAYNDNLICGVMSATPEDKMGPIGFFPPDTIKKIEFKNFVCLNRFFLYRIDFWNKENANAPAQEVFIRDTLNTSFNDHTLTFKEVGFLKWKRELNGGHYFNVNVDIRPDQNLIVNVEGKYDQDSREISWTFRSLDPQTGELPEDPTVGFLPPIDSTGYQIGWVSYSVKPKDGLSTGTKITNQAYVNFDGVGPWNPAPKEAPWFNTIDADVPSSHVLPLSKTQAADSFTVQWAGTDIGSGIINYSIYVSEDNGIYTHWLQHTNDTTGVFHSSGNHEYKFYSIARDGAGNIEAPPDSFDAKTTVITGVEIENENIPKVFSLSQNYPNPFNPNTVIEFEVPKYSRVTIKIYDILGREVYTLVHKKFEPGKFKEIWNGKNNNGILVSTGIYFIRMQAQGFVKVKKVLLLK